MVMPRTWTEMRASVAARLERQTGHDVSRWNERIAQTSGLDGESALRAWLTSEEVTGYQQMLLVMERFGYPDYLLATADELLDGQYADRPQLRPLLAAVVTVVAAFGPVDIQYRKTYTSLLTPRRAFAAVKPTTKTRVDVALRLDGTVPGGRLLDGRSTAGGTINVRFVLASVGDLDTEALALLRRAYDENC